MRKLTNLTKYKETLDTSAVSWQSVAASGVLDVITLVNVLIFFAKLPLLV